MDTAAKPALPDGLGEGEAGAEGVVAGEPAELEPAAAVLVAGVVFPSALAC